MEHVLLIAGGGTLGTYVTKELVSRNIHVDVICLEDYESNQMVTYYKERVTFEYLQTFLAEKKYSAIVDFIHYLNVKDLENVYRLYSEHTEQFVYLSSYRVYANEEHPITENSPTLFDVPLDKEFMETENYALPKLRGEAFLKSQPKKNWTIVRPVISFSGRRFDLFMYSGQVVITKAQNKEKIFLPEEAKSITAGLDWAGNTGKLIGKLLLNPKALGETFTISSAPNLTWGEVADIYHEVIGADIAWVSMEEYLNCNPKVIQNNGLKYDRMLDRTVDTSKVLAATGTKKADFTALKDALKFEFERLPKEEVLK